MNRHYYVLIMLLVASVFTSCKKSDIAHENDFDKSYKAWLDFKKSSNDSYLYKTNFASWTGISGETTISVWKGKIISRSYIEKGRDHQTNQIVIRQEWSEDSTNLHSHDHGDKAYTLDEIYNTAKTVWLIKNKDADISLETKNNGMISACGFVPKNCADDCFIGIHISQITAIVD